MLNGTNRQEKKKDDAQIFYEQEGDGMDLPMLKRSIQGKKGDKKMDNG